MGGEGDNSLVYQYANGGERRGEIYNNGLKRVRVQNGLSQNGYEDPTSHDMAERDSLWGIRN